jgi:hypothetical protein
MNKGSSKSAFHNCIASYGKSDPDSGNFRQNADSCRFRQLPHNMHPYEQMQEHNTLSQLHRIMSKKRSRFRKRSPKRRYVQIPPTSSKYVSVRRTIARKQPFTTVFHNRKKATKIQETFAKPQIRADSTNSLIICIRMNKCSIKTHFHNCIASYGKSDPDSGNFRQKGDSCRFRQLPHNMHPYEQMQHQNTLSQLYCIMSKKLPRVRKRSPNRRYVQNPPTSSKYVSVRRTIARKQPFTTESHNRKKATQIQETFAKKRYVQIPPTPSSYASV